jgi:D-alanine-D-alanine ligase
MSVLVLYNQPLLPTNHPDYLSEYTIVYIAEAIKKRLDEGGYAARLMALGAEPEPLWAELRQHRPDAVFNLYEGQVDNSETETYVAGLLEWAGIPFTGSPAQTLSLCRAKDRVKYLLKGAGLPTADFMIVDELPVPRCTVPFPVIVKPARLDASVGVEQKSVCTSQAELDSRVEYVLTTYGGPVLVEQFIMGREIHVPLVELPELRTLSPREIRFVDPTPGAWPIITFSAKWNSECPAFDQAAPAVAELPEAAHRTLSRICTSAFRLLGCRDYARMDLRMNERGEFFILEVNPNPEISDEANFGGSDIVQRDLILGLISRALQRRHLPRPTFTPTKT